MKVIPARFVLSILVVGFVGSCGNQQGNSQIGSGSSETHLKGAYLGQELPGSEPVLFAPGLVSTAAVELSSTFTPDGKELYQTLVVNGWGFSAIISRRDGLHGWGDPEVAPFSGRYNDIDPNLSPDGNNLFFVSLRPVNPVNKELSEGWDIWTTVRENSDSPWAKARRLPEPVNSRAAELYPSVAASGTVYFGSNREGGFGGFDIYRAEAAENEYAGVENLGPQVNSEHAETDAFIAPNQSYVIVTVTGRPDSRGKNDLYISFRQHNGNWGKLHHMGDSINTPAKEYCPVVSPDGRLLFFTRGKDDSVKLHSGRPKSYRELAEMTYSWRNNLENIYWSNTEVLKREAYE